MNLFLDICDISLNKSGEELCGDQIKIHKNGHRTLIVLSDGLGSGVKASILATLTAEIIVTMLKADIPLHEVIATVIGTLPICKVRKIAYATFTILEVDQGTGRFRITNFDNPPVLYFHRRHLAPLEEHTETILGRDIHITEGDLHLGDFIGLFSDGVLHAGLGTSFNFGWGRENVARHIENQFLYSAPDAQHLVDHIMRKTHALYGETVGDDATFVGVYARDRHSLMVFTGPPLDEHDDDQCARQLLKFDGRTAICGGTTANLVGNYLGEVVKTDLSTLREDVPPIGSLSAIDLVTEGIITMSKALDLMRACAGKVDQLPRDRNGAVLLAEELLTADSIDFLVGQKINEFYQNPLLPHNLSIRKNLVEEMAIFLRGLKKDVHIAYC